MDIDANDKAAYLEHLDNFGQQYMVQRNNILTNPDLDEASKNSMLADLDSYYEDQIAMFGNAANYNVSVFGEGSTGASNFLTGDENLTPEQSQALNNISPVITDHLDDSQGYSFDQLSELENINPNYIDYLDPNGKYTPEELSQLANISPDFLSVLNDDLVYTPDEIALLKDVHPVTVGFLEAKKFGYTPEQLALMKNVNPGVLQYIKPGARYSPQQIGLMSGVDPAVLAGHDSYSLSPSEVRKISDSVTAYNEATKPANNGLLDYGALLQNYNPSLYGV
jgi:hypothetical protein